MIDDEYNGRGAIQAVGRHTSRNDDRLIYYNTRKLRYIEAGYRHQRLRFRRPLDRELLPCPSTLAGNVLPSKAAVMTSAGRSMFTPSEYTKASSGEYSGGSRRERAAEEYSTSSSPGEVDRPPELAVRRWSDRVRACKWIS